MALVRRDFNLIVFNLFNKTSSLTLSQTSQLLRLLHATRYPREQRPIHRTTALS